MRNKIISYINLLRPGPPPSRRDDEMKSESSWRFSKWKKMDRHRKHLQIEYVFFNLERDT